MKTISFLILALGLSGCTMAHCKRGKDMATETKPGSERVLVFKHDGSVQCEKNSGKSLDAMAKDLDGIAIYSKQKREDGLMRVQVCGAPTGTNNVYEIDSSNLQKALDVGFKLWKDPSL